MKRNVKNSLLLKLLLPVILIGCFAQNTVARNYTHSYILKNIYSVNPIVVTIPADLSFKDNVSYYLHKASEFETKKDYIQAIAFYQKAIELDPQHLIAHYNLGECYYTLWKDSGDSYYEQLVARKFLLKAEDEYIRVNSLNPNISVVYFKLARIATIKGKVDQAISYYNEGLEVSPENTVMLFNLASLYEDSGEIELAKVYYKKCLKLDKSFAHAYNNLGLLYEKEENYDEALKLYKKTLKYDSSHVYALINIGNLYSLKGNQHKAEKILLTASKYHPLNPWVHMHLGDVYEKQGKFELALEEYLKFANLKPDYSKCYYLICNLLDKMGKKQEAVQIGMLYLELAPEGSYALEIQLIIARIKTELIRKKELSKFYSNSN